MGKQQLRPPVLPTTISLLSNSRTQNDLRWEEMFPIAYLHAFRPSFVDSYVSAKTVCWNDVVAYQNSNLEPKHYECSALTVEL